MPQINLDTNTRRQRWPSILFKVISTLFLIINTAYAQAPAECDVVYAVHDKGIQDSQIFSYNLNDGQFRSVGPLYTDLDLEGFDAHPTTHKLYTTTGQNNSQLYTVDASTGVLEKIGDIGFDNVTGLAFHPDGGLWASADQGLLQINIDTGAGTIANPVLPGFINGLAWHNDGTQLFAVTSSNESSTLWVIDEGNTWQVACNDLPKKIESLETLPDGSLVYSFHNDNKLNIHSFDINSCQTLSDGEIDTPYNDIEGLAWSAFSCTVSNLDFLRAYLEGLEGAELVEIQDDGSIQVTINGEIYHSKLDDNITSGEPSEDGNVESTGDQNGDGIDDFLITYPSGDQQILYYYGLIDDEPTDCQTLVAPPIDPTVISIPSLVTQFIYTGDDPIQTGVATGTINLEHAATLRGKVTDTQGEILPNVNITIKDHAEYGQTVTTCDGYFNMAVNGGNTLTVNYQKNGYLPVQRTIKPARLEYAIVDDIAMTPLDSIVTKIDLTADTPIQVAKGSVVTDEDGSRQAVILFPQDLTATMTLPDGSTQALTELDVRATEYTVGENGPDAMPGPLPPESAYTYAVELSADQAIAAGSTHIDFNQPIPLYVDNFIGFPTGGIVPIGWYDYEKAEWIPSRNGRVIEIINIENGIVELDVDGSGQVADSEALAVLNITEAEKQELAKHYTVGTSLWRGLIPHFTPWDYNWPYTFPKTAKKPKSENTTPKTANEDNPDDSCKQSGCIIEAEKQVLGETIAIAGTPFTLNYRSNSTLGYKAAYKVDIPLIGDDIPKLLKNIIVEISIAGRRFSHKFPPIKNGTFTFTWDGLDYFQRPLQGRQKARIRIGYEYHLVYASPGDFSSSFARAGSGSGMSVRRNKSSGILWGTTYRVDLGTWYPIGTELGNFSLDIHHTYDAVSKDLYLGYGKQENANETVQNLIIETVAGNGGYGKFKEIYEGKPATQVPLYNPASVAFNSKGELHIGVMNSYKVIKVDSDTNTIHTVAGTGEGGFAAEGELATTANLRHVTHISFDSNDNLYIANTHHIHKVDTKGVIHTVVGSTSGEYFNSVEVNGKLATEVNLSWIHGFAFDSSDDLYIASYAFNSLFKLDGNTNIINKLLVSDVGTVYNPNSVLFGKDGSLYIANGGYNSNIRRVGTNNSIEIIAGTEHGGFNGDGGIATEIEINDPYSMVFGPDNNLYFSDGNNHRIRKIDADGVISTIAGGGDSLNKNKELALEAKLNRPRGIVFGPDNYLYITEGNYVHRLRPSAPDFSIKDTTIASKDASLLYVFSASGHHLRTLDSITGQTIYTFSYSPEGYLTSIEDLDGDITHIERNGKLPLAIIAPDGQRTILSVNENGYLDSVINPEDEAYLLSYTDKGLLTEFVNPRGHKSIYRYDDLGLLIEDTDAANGGWSLARIEHEDDDGYTTTLTSREGQTHTYSVIPKNNGEIERIQIAPDGTETKALIKASGDVVMTNADGTTVVSEQAPDPRFGIQAPFTEKMTITTPNGLKGEVKAEKTVWLSNKDDPLSLISLSNTMTINGRRSSSVYDATNKKLTSTSAAGRRTTSYYDDKGRIIREETYGLAKVYYSYDERGRLTQITEGDGNEARTVTFSFDPNTGYLSQVTDALGRTEQFTRDAVGRILAQTLPDERQIQYEYDDNGNITSIKPPSRPEHTYSYDAVDLPSEYQAPTVNSSGHETLSSFNRDKQLTRVTLADNKVIDFNYDQAGRVEEIVLPKGTQSYSYDSETGQVISVSDEASGSVINYEYDGSLLLSEQWTNSIEGSVNYSYNNDFRLQTTSVNEETAVNYGYDKDGLMTQAGDLTLLRDRYNGLLKGSTLDNVKTILTHTQFGELKTEVATYDGTELYRAEYSYDKLSRITQKSEVVNGQSSVSQYQYDLTGRLIQVDVDSVVTTYQYDGNSNRTHINGVEIASYDNQDRLLTYENQRYTHTTNGERLTKTENGETTRYHYDVSTNLTQVRLASGQTVSYIIDGQDRRVGKVVDGFLEEGYLYQGSINPIATLDRNGEVKAQFIYGSQDHVPDYMLQDGAVYRLVTDHLGSVRLVVEVSTGRIVQQLDYDAWGQVLVDTNPGFQPFGYVGSLYESRTGLVRFGARDYDPHTGRWTAQDPILFDGGDSNLYRYVFNNPINLIDPDGLSPTGERGTTGGTSGQNSKNKYKHCKEDKNDPNYIICKHHQSGKTVRKPKPSDWDEDTNNESRTNLSTDILIGGGKVVLGTYLTYRCIRTVPSLFPPLWWTLPGNLATP
ncbi:RHS repeat-associated core domain-containing protein [Candidatus Albibeggiatoa sp. nov. BB20]|uniref:RHS repeat-associated core domain-containing protein n=1 Tax=Candidatus Albibeggiatoa sp. nov. BB20 TaxID=3162723 RepID=UPI0033658CC8